MSIGLLCIIILTILKKIEGGGVKKQQKNTTRFKVVFFCVSKGRTLPCGAQLFFPVEPLQSIGFIYLFKK